MAETEGIDDVICLDLYDSGSEVMAEACLKIVYSVIDEQECKVRVDGFRAERPFSFRGSKYEKGQTIPGVMAACVTEWHGKEVSLAYEMMRTHAEKLISKRLQLKMKKGTTR